MSGSRFVDGPARVRAGAIAERVEARPDPAAQRFGERPQWPDRSVVGDQVTLQLEKVVTKRLAQGSRIRKQGESMERALSHRPSPASASTRAATDASICASSAAARRPLSVMR